MELQLSMFDMLDQYETPEIPPEMQKQGVKGWIIDGSGISFGKMALITTGAGFAPGRSFSRRTPTRIGRAAGANGRTPQKAQQADGLEGVNGFSETDHPGPIA